MLPDEIDVLEKAIIHLNDQLGEHASDADKINELIAELAPLQAELEEKEERYLMLLDRVENMS
ncbi:MAG: hypothetical protein KGV45_00105 [Gammaproteobacteria bacterium]|nr:hypothetical protein [Gammaproteobacteria bacterium]